MTLLPWEGCIQDEVPLAGTLRPSFSVLSLHCDLQALVCDCIFDDNFIRKGKLRRAKIVVAVDSGFYRRNDYQRARSLAWRRDSRRFGSGALFLFPCQFATTLRAACIQKEGRSAEILRPSLSICGYISSMHCDTRVLVCNCILDDDFLRSSNVRLAKIVEDVDKIMRARTC